MSHLTTTNTHTQTHMYRKHQTRWEKIAHPLCVCTGVQFNPWCTSAGTAIHHHTAHRDSIIEADGHRWHLSHERTTPGAQQSTRTLDGKSRGLFCHINTSLLRLTHSVLRSASPKTRWQIAIFVTAIAPAEELACSPSGR